MRRGLSGNGGRKTRLRRKVEEEVPCRGGKSVEHLQLWCRFSDIRQLYVEGDIYRNGKEGGGILDGTYMLVGVK